MKDVLAIMFNDAHMKNGNEYEVYQSAVHMAKYAVDNGIKNLIFAGDLFDSRSYQRQEQLTTLSRILDMFHRSSLTLYMFPGNHDKTVYSSPNSFLDPYKHHPCVRFNREMKRINIDGITIDLLPFFSDDKLVPMLEEAEGADILISHFEMKGSNHLGNVSKKANITKTLLKKWKKVYLGHYHNFHEITKDIIHLPSFRQDNFGEDSNKGFTLIKKDLSYEIIKGVFREFIKVDVDASVVTVSEIKKLIKKYHGAEQTIRIEFSGTEAQCKTISKELFAGSGIDVKLKYDEVYDSADNPPGLIIEKYSKEDILTAFEEFCVEKDFDLSEGSKLLEKFLNK